jgi:glycosyltransferase involved in cell wall biosynthesis
MTAEPPPHAQPPGPGSEPRAEAEPARAERTSAPEAEPARSERISAHEAEPPREVLDLVEARQEARRGRDFARADALREELRATGWLVNDTPSGPELEKAPPWEPLDPATATPRWDEPDLHEVSVVVHVLGWPGDVERAVRSLASHCAGIDYEVVLVDDGAGGDTAVALEGLAGADPRVRVLHVEAPIGFGAAMNLGMAQATGRVIVWLDPHVEATGDVLGPLVKALGEPSIGLAGGWGVVTHSLLEFEADDGPEVDAVEGYLLAVPRAIAERVQVDPKHRYYRNADLDFSFAVRDLPGDRATPGDRGTSGDGGTSGGPFATGERAEPGERPGPGHAGRLRALRVPVPAERHRHRAYHETDPVERDRASKRNYDRFLSRWKSRTDLLTRGFTGYHRHPHPHEL